MTAALNAAPTFGWDTVFALPISRVNQAIVSQKSSPTKLNYVDSQSGVTLAADFDDWQVIPQGDGALIRMRLPLKNLTGSYKDLQGNPVAVSCPQLDYIVQIRLHYLEHDDSDPPLIGPDGKQLPPPDAGLSRYKLLPKTTSTNPQDPIVEFIAVSFVQTLTPASAKYTVEGALEDWCNANLIEFAHIFAIIDLNDEIATGAFAFCKPHLTDYAYIDHDTPDSSILAVLCMTSDDPPPVIQQVSNFAIPSGSQAGFLISPRRFILDMIIPALRYTWPKMPADALQIGNDDISLKLKPNTSFELPDVQHDGSTYTPVMSSFALEIISDVIKIDSYTEVEVSAGIYATCQATHWYRIKLGTNSKGEQTLLYEESQPASVVNGSRSDQGIEILKIVMMVITAILAILVLVLSGGTAAAVSIALLCLAVGEFAIGQIERNAQNDPPGIDQLVTSANAPIVWPDSKDFTLNVAGMNVSLQLGGTWN